jgi:ribonuclease VapC
VTVVDTSAVLSILFQEEDAALFAEAIGRIDAPLISAASVLEAGIGLIRRVGPEALQDLFEFLERAGFRIEAISIDQMQIAISAYERFGKRRHSAGLNFGDCFTYALAKATGETLLFKGNDFTSTDLPVLNPSRP